MPTLNVELTDDQYTRFKAAYKKYREMEVDATEEQLVAALKREAAAITYAGERDGIPDENWTF